jgi:1-acyl-sn-glycerol-3-phosphate acyltransferase
MERMVSGAREGYGCGDGFFGCRRGLPVINIEIGNIVPRTIPLPRNPIRAAWRLLGFLVIVAAAVGEVGLRALLRRRLEIAERAAWLHRWTGRALRWLGIRLRVEGIPPSSGLLVSNHLGYLDVFVLSAIAPTVFVSNHEVRSWPLAGALARMAGTIFIDRRRRADVVRVGDTLVPVVDAGQPVALFLEGTSSAGTEVRPFHSSLLAPAVRNRWPVTPAFIAYFAPDVTVARELCFWGDAVFFPHFLNLIGLRGAEAHVRFGEPLTAEGDRRSLATSLRLAVCALGMRST